jgi:tetratricopeptide (TPR) repeat protein
VDFEEGRYARALSQFESLDEKATYDASGWGRGSVSNWVAKTYLAQGDYRSAVLAFGLVDGADPDEIATAKLWEGVALQSLGMEELARRMWKQMPDEVGTLVQGSGKGAVKTAQYLTGVLSEREYLQSVSSIGDFKNDMHYFMGRVAKEKEDPSNALAHFQQAIEFSRGREFPYGLAMRETNPSSGDGKETDLEGESIGVIEGESSGE